MKGVQRGYTILEVLIFIAVSALIFVFAMIAISGRQEQVQFTQGVREFEAKVQDILNDITTGYYAANPTIRCEIVAGNASLDFSLTNNEDLGTNNNCIYIGKVIQVLPDGADADKRMFIYNLVGKRYADTENSLIADTITEVSPKLVSSSAPGSNDSSEEYFTRYGLKITKLIELPTASPAPEFGAFSIISNFAGGGSGVTTSQSQSVRVGTIKGTSVGDTESELKTVVDQFNNTSSVNTGFFNEGSDGVVICLQDATSSVKKASITISSSGTRLQIDDYVAECD
ncbi:hypothetical protein KC959_01945 [Candidatus Saccharibacteria bacterium]|nr:hypothetical protein [Candidatus Saccharibacteria bacterium]